MSTKNFLIAVFVLFLALALLPEPVDLIPGATIAEWIGLIISTLCGIVYFFVTGSHQNQPNLPTRGVRQIDSNVIDGQFTRLPAEQQPGREYRQRPVINRDSRRR